MVCECVREPLARLQARLTCLCSLLAQAGRGLGDARIGADFCHLLECAWNVPPRPSSSPPLSSIVIRCT